MHIGYRTTSMAMIMLVTLVGSGLGFSPRHAEAQVASCETPDVGKTPRTDYGLLWGGTRHVWGYNHRVKNLGDSIRLTCDEATCQGVSTHTAKTGIGPDTALYESHHAWIHTTSADFQSGQTSIAINGQENELISGTKQITISAHPHLRNRNHYVALLNGFVLARDDASNVQTMKLDDIMIHVRDVTYLTASGKLRFDIDYVVRLDCDSAECLANRPVQYQLVADYLIVAGDAGSFRYSSELHHQHDYTWEAGEPLEIPPAQTPLVNGIESTLARHGQTFHTLTGAPRFKREYAAGLVGLRGFGIDLDKEHHLLELTVRVRNQSYDSSMQGTAQFMLDVYFKNWTEGMRQLNNFSTFSFGEDGRARMDAWVTLLQFREALINHTDFSDSISSQVGKKVTAHPLEDAGVPVVSITVSDPIVCAGGQLQMTAVSEAPALFQWDPGPDFNCVNSCNGPSVQLTPTSAPSAPPGRSTTLRVTAHYLDGTTGQAHRTVWLGPPEQPMGPDVSLCLGALAGGEVQIGPARGATSYNWNAIDPGVSVIGACLSGMLFGLEAGSQRYEITAINQCGNSTSGIFVAHVNGSGSCNDPLDPFDLLFTSRDN